MSTNELFDGLLKQLDCPGKLDRRALKQEVMNLAQTFANMHYYHVEVKSRKLPKEMNRTVDILLDDRLAEVALRAEDIPSYEQSSLERGASLMVTEFVDQFFQERLQGAPRIHGRHYKVTGRA